ncbi:hypothetical protein HHI36_011273 [Cryptolaemus montrouzieri]|uniref:CHK kinase-like domain-containing protein n=1 Tax=Cryptolaemus montrouzieri TaxID=559131 RepID=A0ABD2MLA6_9CUCU
MSELHISEILTEKDFNKILEQYFEKPSKIIDCQLYKAHSETIGYLGDHFRLKITYHNQKNCLQEETFFVKTKPIFNTSQAEYVQEIGVFKKECLICENILPMLTAIAGINFSPKCYLVNENCLVFDDLMARKFTMRGPVLNFEECKSVVICLAKFHCTSVIYEELNSINGRKYRLIDEFEEAFQETCFSFQEGHPRNNWLKNNITCVIDLVQYLNYKNWNEIIDKLNKLVYTEMETFIKPSKKFRNVLTHCDLWCSNFMINEKMECVLVDFQMARYCPPAYDLLLTLFLNTTKEILQKYFEELLNLYYCTFKDMLTSYKLIPEKVFPREFFFESVEYMKLPTTLEAMFFSTNTLFSPETFAGIKANENNYREFYHTNRSKYVLREFKENQSFRKGIMNVLVPLIDLLNNKN